MKKSLKSMMFAALAMQCVTLTAFAAPAAKNITSFNKAIEFKATDKEFASYAKQAGFQLIGTKDMNGSVLAFFFDSKNANISGLESHVAPIVAYKFKSFKDGVLTGTAEMAAMINGNGLSSGDSAKRVKDGYGSMWFGVWDFNCKLNGKTPAIGIGEITKDGSSSSWNLNAKTDNGNPVFFAVDGKYDDEVNSGVKYLRPLNKATDVVVCPTAKALPAYSE